jgi:ribose transport system substrate-binding protein
MYYLRLRDKKELIARWAAGMVEDGDVIILDASTTVLHIASFLRDRRNLTIFTNGISVAQALAKEPSNTVIVLGGILRASGNAITGAFSKQLLQDYHVRTAFVSCSAFKAEIGFFEMDLQEAQMKQLMLQSAQRKVAMVDATKIGEVGLTAFGTLDDFHYFVTDDLIADKDVSAIRTRDTHVIVCGEQTTQTYPPTKTAHTATGYRIGFANLSENTPFSRDVRRSLEKAAQASDMVELIVADNQLDPDIALQVAGELIAQNVDLVIEYQIDETTGNLIAHKFQQHGIPIIAVDIPMVGGVYFGVNNYEAGKMAGVELGHKIQAKWQGAVDYLIVLEQRRAGSLPAMRIQGQIDGVLEIIPSIHHEHIIRIDSDNTSEGTYHLVQDILPKFERHAKLAIICFNDDAAVGALYAAIELSREDSILLIGQGADRRLRTEMRKPNSPVVGATAYRPEDYGEHLIQLALDILDGKQVPPAVYTNHHFISPNNVDQYDDDAV